MKNTKIQIELSNHSHFDNKDTLYAAISFAGGYITKNYILDDSTNFTGNHAFYNILFDYFRIEDKLLGVHYDVQRAVSTMSFCAKCEKFIPTLNEVLRTILMNDYNEKTFEDAKQFAKDSFATHYKEGSFRARNKAYEFSDLNKAFTLQSLIDDIEQIDFSVFKTCAKALLVPGNIYIHASGEIGKIDLSKLALSDMDNNHSVRIKGSIFNPYLRQDAHIINIARADYNLIIAAFEFLNPEITNLTKLLILEIFANKISARDIDIWVDSLDASIIFHSEDLRKYKNLLTKISEGEFIAAKNTRIREYVILLKNNPEHFVIKAANLMAFGIYVDQYLDILNKCSYEMFVEICTKADYKISEAQLVLRKTSHKKATLKSEL